MTRLYLVLMIRKEIYNRVHYYSTLISNEYIKYISSESLLLYNNVGLWTIHYVGRNKVCQIRSFYSIWEDIGRYVHNEEEEAVDSFYSFFFFEGICPTQIFILMIRRMRWAKISVGIQQPHLHVTKSYMEMK